MWHCLNLVSETQGAAAGVLLRAGEILSGAAQARSRRPAARRDTELARGPARLATALDVDRRFNGQDVCSSEPAATLRVLSGSPPGRERVATGPRTGVGGDGALHPWRFWIDGDPTVSRYRAHRPRRRTR